MGKEIDAFIDSGSSVMSKRLLLSLHLRPDPGSSIPVTGIGGPTHSVGCITVIVLIGRIELPVTFHIFDTDTTDLMIGTHDAARFHLLQDHANDIVLQNAGPIPAVLLTERVSKDGLISSLDSNPIFGSTMQTQQQMPSAATQSSSIPLASVPSVPLESGHCRTR